MTLTDTQRERYARQLVLPHAGVKGQERLARGKVLVIGAGGLGSPAAMYLAAAGVGTIGIADSDTVELSNLQRQIIHSSAVLGIPKVESAKKTLADINPDVELITYHTRIEPSNINHIIKDTDYDFIIDAVDNFTGKFLINDACVALGKPFSHGEVLGWEGQLMSYVPGKGPCYRCVFGKPPPNGAIPDGREAGVLGAVCGVVGSLQAAEAVKHLLGLDGLLTGFILSFNALNSEFRKVRIEQNKNCGACNEKAKELRL